MVSLTVLDGSSTIGGNKIYLEETRRGLLLDFGMNFAKYGQFFQEFLSERSSRGIYDLVHLGLIPKIDIYRSDLAPSDVDTSGWPKPNAEVVLLSHAHLDHCANVGLLRYDVPIIASPISVNILKAWRDSSPASIGSEISYLSPKHPVEGTSGLVLESDRSGTYVSCDFYCTVEPPSDLRVFTSTRPGQEGPRANKVEPGRLRCVDEAELPFEVKAYPVDHSIYGANGYTLSGDETIAYTGDFRLHGKRAQDTLDFIKVA